MKPMRLLRILRKAEISLLSLGLMMTNVPPVNGEELSSAAESIVVAEENSVIEAETVLDYENPPELEEEETIITSDEGGEVITPPASADPFDDFSQAEDLPPAEGLTSEESREYVAEAASAEGFIEESLEENEIEDYTGEVPEEYSSSVPEEYIIVPEESLPDIPETHSEEIPSPAEENNVPETEILEIVTSPKEENTASEEVSTEDLITPWEETEPDSSFGEESTDDEEETTLTEEVSSESETEIEIEEEIEVDNAGAWTGKETVSVLKATSTPTGTMLVWGAVPNADGYLIGAIQNGNKYKQIGFTTNTIYTDKDASLSLYSYYWVFPYKKVVTKKTVVERWKNGVLISTETNEETKIVPGSISPYYVYGIKQLVAPSGFKAQSQAASVRLSWNSVSGAAGYVIKVRRGTSDVSVLANVNALTYTDKEVSYKEMSYYWVYAYTRYGEIIRPGAVSSYTYGRRLSDPSAPSKPTQEELIKGRIAIPTEIGTIERKYSQNGDIPLDSVKSLIAEVEKYIIEQYNNGIIQSYEIGDYGIKYVDTAKSEWWYYTPPIEDMFAGGSALQMRTYPLSPFSYEININEASLLSRISDTIPYYTSETGAYNSSVTLKRISQISDNQIIIITAHGAFPPNNEDSAIITTGVEVPASYETPGIYKKTWKGVPELARTICHDKDGNLACYLAVTPAYIHYECGSMNNSLVILVDCFSAYNNSLMEAFYDHGANVIGFSHLVTPEYANKVLDSFFAKALEMKPFTDRHYTVKEAFEQMLSEIGSFKGNDKVHNHGWFTCTPKRFGDDDYTLWLLGETAGKVTDIKTKDPIPGATITFKSMSGTYSTTSDTNGNYSIYLEEGDYKVSASKLGYKKGENTVNVVKDKKVCLDFKLEKAKIAVNPTSLSIYTGETKTIEAFVSGTNEKPQWTSSNNSVATVNSSGIVSGIKQGTATITASVEGASATCSITVNDKEINISLNPKAITMPAGASKTIQCITEGTDQTPQIKWTSSDAAIASVSSSGVVTGNKAGMAIITASIGNTSASCLVTVEENVGITLLPTSCSIEVGETVTISASVTGSTKKPIWTSSNTAVATVDSNGIVIGEKEGGATITASIGDVSAKCSVTVIAAESVQVSGRVFEVFNGNSVSGATVELHCGSVGVQYSHSDKFGKWTNEDTKLTKSSLYSDTVLDSAITGSNGTFSLSIPKTLPSDNGRYYATIVVSKSGWLTHYWTIVSSNLEGFAADDNISIPFAKEGIGYTVYGYHRKLGSDHVLMNNDYINLHPYQGAQFNVGTWDTYYTYSPVKLYYNELLIQTWYAPSHNGNWWHVFSYWNGKVTTANKTDNNEYYSYSY